MEVTLKNLTKDTKVMCPEYDETFFGTVEELKKLIQFNEDYGRFRIVEVVVMRKEPFCSVNDDFVTNMVRNEIERQGECNQRSTESGDEMDEIECIILGHIKADYKSIMKKMPQLYYSTSEEIQIDLNDF